MLSFSLATLGVVYLVSEWVIRVVMLVVVPFRRTSDAARSWLLLVMFLPWPALVLYLLIGKATFPKWRRQRIAELPELLAGHSGPMRGTNVPQTEHMPERFVATAGLVQNMGRMPVAGGNRVETLADYEGTLDLLVADIEAAAHHAHLLFYIFADDSAGRKIMDALCRAAARGVECRVLIDAIGSRPWSKVVLARLRQGGVSAHLALPIQFFRRKSARADLRNHRKIAVIDGIVAYTGSQNIVDRESSPGIINLELMLRLHGPIVNQLTSVFLSDWFIETDEELAAARYMGRAGDEGETLAQLLASGPDFPAAGVEHLIVTLLYAATERVTIVTPYFVPSEPVLVAMKGAVLRGVAVELVVPKVMDHFLVRLAHQAQFARLLEAGVDVRLHLDRFLHAKNIVVDDEIALVGSSNMDIRSFLLNCEVTLLVYDREVTARIRAEQKRWLARSEKLDAETWARRPLGAKVVENLANLVGALL